MRSVAGSVEDIVVAIAKDRCHAFFVGSLIDPSEMRNTECHCAKPLNLFGSPTWARTRDLRINRSARSMANLCDKSKRYRGAAGSIHIDIGRSTASYARVNGSE